MGNRFTRGPATRWDEAALDATLGKLTGKTMREAPHFKTSQGKALEVIDTDATPHTKWKHKEAARAVAQLYPLVGLCRAAGLPEPVPEYVFHPVRKWRLDYAWPLEKVYVEINGGLWLKGGAHALPSNIERDYEKQNAAVLLGWRGLIFIPKELHHAIPALQILFGMA